MAAWAHPVSSRHPGHEGLRRKRLIAETEGQLWLLHGFGGIDDLFSDGDPVARLRRELGNSKRVVGMPALRAPLRSQEVWAAGVTYLRSRTARVAESQGGRGRLASTTACMRR